RRNQPRCQRNRRRQYRSFQSHRTAGRRVAANGGQHGRTGGRGTAELRQRPPGQRAGGHGLGGGRTRRQGGRRSRRKHGTHFGRLQQNRRNQIGRASCRER